MKAIFSSFVALCLAVAFVGCGEHVPDQGPQGPAAEMEGVEHSETGGDGGAGEEAPAE